jgi:hypothetical protein
MKHTDNFILPSTIAYICDAEQVGVAVMLLAPVREMLASNLDRGTGYHGLCFSWFSSSPLANAAILPRLGYYHFLPNPFQLIIHPSSYH